MQKAFILLLDKILEAIGLAGGHGRNIEHRGGHHGNEQAANDLAALQMALLIQQRHNERNEEPTLHQIYAAVVQQEHVDDLAKCAPEQDRQDHEDVADKADSCHDAQNVGVNLVGRIRDVHFPVGKLRVCSASSLRYACFV